MALAAGDVAEALSHQRGELWLPKGSREAVIANESASASGTSSGQYVSCPSGEASDLARLLRRLEVPLPFRPGCVISESETEAGGATVHRHGSPLVLR